MWPPPGPALTVDAIITLPGQGLVLVRRRNPPHGWALPGGFVDRGETLEAAVSREVLEETGLRLVQLRQFAAYSDPARDPRLHTVSVVFAAVGEGEPAAGDDAAGIGIFPEDALPAEIAFDHRTIIEDYLRSR